MWRPNAHKHLLAAIHKRVVVLERVPVDLVLAAHVAVSVARVERPHVLDAALCQLGVNGPVEQGRVGAGGLHLVARKRGLGHATATATGA